MLARRLKCFVSLILWLLGFSVYAQGIPDWFPITFTAELSSQQVVPPAEAQGSATIIAILTGQQLSVTGFYQHITLPDGGVVSLVGAAIRQAAAGETGPILSLERVAGSYTDGDLLHFATQDENAGTLSAVYTLSDEQVSALKAGLWYIELYSFSLFNPIMRGQLSSAVDYAALSFTPDAHVPTAEDLLGSWTAEALKDSWQDELSAIRFNADGHFDYLDSFSPFDTWSLRDGILSFNNHTLLGNGAVVCYGEYTFYVELLADDQLNLFGLRSVPDCALIGDGEQFWRRNAANPYGLLGEWTRFVRVDP